ncbi:polysaccharide pyruvyl transferase family protein [Bifidobacterium pullorum subsp. saeculare]|uniref:polysaccharide pyruvyl transferase family protein n=1 Tax=Bifidobacterium pullorum TaxID=78448 RepID=UPI001955F9B2|nr:polysaccharide pyruvyl transferase family protein [Bifidobacterium pullorum]MBM6691896.1 polysaccharide pyruvyl transferase family protein [Bifidobacterium pullorum subsp. saeculare]
MLAGILTFINTLNYGAELQAYALSKTLSNLGYPTRIINYECAAVKERETHPLPRIIDIKNPRHFAGLLRRYFAFFKRNKNFKRFNKKYISLGDVIHNPQEILNQYPRIIVGSDQVWCPEITGYDLTFILPGHRQSNQKIISYAASFGDKPFPVKYKSEFSKAISQFNALSVREENGINILKSWNIDNAVVCVDPTLLLDQAQWNEIARPVKTPKCYVLAYVVSEREKTLHYAKQAARKLNAKLLYLNAYDVRPIFGAKNVNSCAPDEFLSLIKNAKLVVTSSFHGLCFSILFNKQFRYALSAKKEKSRLYNLASQLGLECYDITNTNLNDYINYSKVNLKISALKADSLNYLRMSLK